MKILHISDLHLSSREDNEYTVNKVVDKIVNQSKNENIDFKQEADNGIQNLGNTPISFSPNTVANFLIKLKPAENFTFGVQNQYVGKQYLDNTNNPD